jgi:hypothetical protein
MNAMNLSVKEAVAIAMDYIRSFGEFFPGRGMRLEETEIAENGNWLVTLSFIDSDTFDTRVYRRFEVDMRTKEVKSMTIRNPLAA